MYKTYTHFPEERYLTFLNSSVYPYLDKFLNVIDLGCGSGKLLEIISQKPHKELYGVDISEESILAAQSALKNSHTELLVSDLLNLTRNQNLKERFDLILSYSVFHLIPGKTSDKFNLLYFLSKKNALIAIDTLPLTIWNALLFSSIGLCYKIGLGPFLIRLLVPFINPKLPTSYIRELSELTYMRTLNPLNFIKLNYLKTNNFKEKFVLLDLKIVKQGRFFSGRKARITIRRK